ncbi:MAG TPA: hypothetical protein VEX60_16405 [Pyrinomonadaceae bacterium]|nr:hypothetical protein [Pyrinomonadaceae bacterium]
MRFSSRLFISVLLLISLAAAAAAQKRMCAKPPPSPFKHNGEIVTSFDSRAGGMRTVLEHPRPVGRGTDLYYLAASFMLQDPRRPSAPTLDLVLVSASPTARLRAGQEPSFVLDGQPRMVSRNVSYKSQPDGSGGALDSVRITLSHADASAIANARKVVARVGGAEIEMTNNHLEALREMVSQLAPSPGRWQTADATSAR